MRDHPLLLPLRARLIGACLVALAFLLAGLLNALLPADSYRLRNLLIFIALQVIPLARVGLAPAFLAKSRHD